jgi:hypothetical protein
MKFEPVNRKSSKLYVGNIAFFMQKNTQIRHISLHKCDTRKQMAYLEFASGILWD